MTNASFQTASISVCLATTWPASAARDMATGTASGTPVASITTSAPRAPRKSPSWALASPADGSIAEVDQSSSTTSLGLSGTLAGADVDVEPLTYGIAGGGSSSLAGYDVALAGSYGTLHVNSSSGAYVYVANAAAIEGLGLKPRLVEGSPLNIKVTRPADLVLAEAAMRALRVAR